MTNVLENKPQTGAKTSLWYYIGRGVGTAQSPEIDWRQLGKIKSLQPGEIQVDTEDESYLDAPNADWKQSAPGQKSVSAASVTLAWMPGDEGQQALMSACMTNSNVTFRIKYPNGAVDIFTGFITSLGKEVNQKDRITRTIKIQPSGKPTYAEELIPALTGIKISAGKSADGSAIVLAGNQGRWTGTASMAKGRVSLTIEPVPSGAALPELDVRSSAPDKALIPVMNAPDVIPLATGNAVLTVTGGGFSDQLTLTVSE